MSDKFACPKCRKGNLLIFEFFDAYDAIEITDGAVTYREAGTDGSRGDFGAECRDCGHKWTPKKSTGQRAVNAAQELE